MVKLKILKSQKRKIYVIRIIINNFLKMQCWLNYLALEHSLISSY